MLLLAMEKAATPSEGLESLATLQAMLVGDPAAQVCAVVGAGFYIVCCFAVFQWIFLRGLISYVLGNKKK